MASSTRSASAATSSGNWTTASGVSASQESEGSTRRIAVGSGTGVGAAESRRRAATPVTAGETIAGVGRGGDMASALGFFVAVGIGAFPAVQEPSAEGGAMIGIAVAVGAAGGDEEAGEPVDIDARRVLGGEHPVGGGGGPVLRRNGPSCPPRCPSAILRPSGALPLPCPAVAGRESSVSWIPVFLCRLCDTVG
jgi:hypothetical protein